MSGVERPGVPATHSMPASTVRATASDPLGLSRFLPAGSTMLLVGGCTGAPAVDVVGSYFPGWMVCALIGIAVAVGLRQVIVLLGLEGDLVLPLVTHAAVALAATLVVWLIWLGH